MDFQLSEQQRELQAAARKFARAEMPAVADMCEETGHPPGREMLNQLGEMGFGCQYSGKSGWPGARQS